MQASVNLVLLDVVVMVRVRAYRLSHSSAARPRDDRMQRNTADCGLNKRSLS